MPPTRARRSVTAPRKNPRDIVVTEIKEPRVRQGVARGTPSLPGPSTVQPGGAKWRKVDETIDVKTGKVISETVEEAPRKKRR